MSAGSVILGPNKVGKRLGLLHAGHAVVAVVVAMAVRMVFLGTDVVHLVDAAALGASLDGAFLGQLFGQGSQSASVHHAAGAALGRREIDYSRLAR